MPWQAVTGNLTAPVNYQATKGDHNMSKALARFIKKNPKLIDEYRAFIVKAVLELERNRVASDK